MNTQFRRILDLIRKTGDRMIVTDPDASDVYVVMDLDAYENLLGGEGARQSEPTPPPVVPPAFEPEPDLDFGPDIEAARHEVLQESLGSKFANPAYHSPEPSFEAEPVFEEEPTFEPEPVRGNQREVVPPPPEPKGGMESEFSEDELDDPDESQFYLEPIE